MTRILALSGSLRRGSFNTALARAARAQAPAGVAVEVATLHGIPLYDADDEAAHGIPQPVQALRARILANDALLMVTPEYNNGVPGVFKNGIDWLSRSGPGLFEDRPVALMGASPGGFGTILSQNNWLQILRYLKVRFWSGGRLLVSHADTLMDAEGELSDPATLKLVGEFVAGFARHLEGR